jgi:hypothetical protein
VLGCLLVAHRDVVCWRGWVVSLLSPLLVSFLTFLKHLELVELADRLRIESDGALVVFVVVLYQVLDQLAGV